MSRHETAPEPFRGGPVRRACALALASAGGSGYLPFVPGTFGSAVTVAGYAALVWAGAGAIGIAAAALLTIPLGIWSAGEAERIYAARDDRRIVIDEVAGQLIALWPITVLRPPESWLEPLPLLAGFLIFRAFDITKPGPIRWAERNFPDGQGVMFDDLLAGLFSALVMAALLWLELFPA